jgi:hypothetical protein
MMLKFLCVLLYCLRWLAWAFQYLIIWPAATLMLLVAMLLWMENTTPGEAMAQEIMAVTHNVSSGEFRIAACRDEPLDPFIPLAPQGKPSGLTLHDAPSAVCHDRGSVVTDAKGYAGHVDGALSAFKPLWIVMASVFAGLAWFLGIRPYFPRYVFVKVASDKGYIRCASSRPERGMGASTIFPMKKQPEKHKGCDVYASPVSCVTYDKNAKFPKKEDDRE